MSISIDRANLPGSGSAKVTWNGANFWCREDLVVPLKHELAEQRSSFYGRVTKTRHGRKIEIELPMFGSWDSPSVFFPSYLTNPTVGSRLFGTSDLPLVLWARNGDKLTVHNARLTGISQFKLAANTPIFGGNFKFVGLIRNNMAVTDANAYFTFANASFTDAGFAMTNFKSKAWTGAWGSRTGFTTILTQDGWTVDFEVATADDTVDGIGVVDQFIETFWVKASCIPIGPSEAQIESNLTFQGSGADVGASIDASTDDLALSDGTTTLTLKAAALLETGLVWGPGKKRFGATVWETTRGFSAGVPQALASVS